MRDKMKFGVVGCGHIGQRHLEVLQNEEGAELSAICDIDPEKLSRFQKLYPDIRAYSSYNEMLEEPGLDIISICTPHGLHAPMSILAAKKGKHILVEKPMALKASDALEMIRCAKENKVRLYVVKQNRFNKPILLTKEALENNRLGRIFMVQCSVIWNRHEDYYASSPWRGKKQLEGGALHTQVSHFIDLLVWWFGELKISKSIYDTLNHDIEIEDCGAAALRFESGVIGSLIWTTCAYNANVEGSITIVGEKGTIKIGGPYLNKIEHWDILSYPLPVHHKFDDEANQYGFYTGSSSNHHLLINELIEEFTERRNGVVEGEEGLLSIKAIEKIYNKH